MTSPSKPALKAWASDWGVISTSSAAPVTPPISTNGAKEITLPVTYLGDAKDPWGQARIGFEAETTINRKEYGLMWNAALETGGFLVGDEVKISLNIQAIGE